MFNFDQKEVARLRKLLAKIVELAEHIEQTGSFESGMPQLVQRYNGIVARLEEIEAVPENLFPKMKEQADSGQLGIETSLLADYLSDLTEEGPASPIPPPDLGSLVALAPFLEASELSRLVRERFAAAPPEPAKEAVSSSPPDLRTIMSLAPHLKRGDVQDMVRTYLARKGQITPQELAHLAPFMDKEAAGELIKTYMPEWFGGASPRRTPGPPPEPPVPTPPEPPPVWEAQPVERAGGTSLQTQQGTRGWEEAPEPLYDAPRLER